MFKKLLITLALCPSVLMAADTLLKVDPAAASVGVGKSQQIYDNVSVEGSITVNLVDRAIARLHTCVVFELPTKKVQPRLYVGGGGFLSISDEYDKLDFRAFRSPTAGVGVKINMPSGSGLTLDFGLPSFVSVSYYLRSNSE